MAASSLILDMRHAHASPGYLLTALHPDLSRKMHGWMNSLAPHHKLALTSSYQDRHVAQVTWGSDLGGCTIYIRGGMEAMQAKRHGHAVHVRAGVIVALPVLLTPFSALADDLLSTSSRQALNANGSTSMNYSTELNGLGTSFGLDMSAPAKSVVPQSVQGTEKVTGTAYARVSLTSMPDWLMWQKGAVNMVVNPTAEESRIGTSFSRTWAVNDGLKATLADSYSVAHNLSGTSSWKTDKSLSVKLEDTGTTLSIGASATDSSTQIQPSVTARQDIFGNLNVTTSVSNNGTSLDKSIRAGLSHRW